MRLTQLILCGVLTVLSAASVQAGPLRTLFGRGRCHGAGCLPAAQQPAPQWVPATPAAPAVVPVTHTVVYGATPGQPWVSGEPTPTIRMPFLLPTTCTNCNGGR